MQLTIKKSDLLPIVKQCASVADRKSTMPILGNILLHANGKLRCSATDLYQSVSAATEAHIATTGSVALDAKGLLERVSMLTGDVTISVKGSAVTLKSGSRRFTMQSIPGVEFPELPTASETGAPLVLDSDTLRRLISGVCFAVSPNETRTSLNSALFECDSGKLRMVATDGHRCSVIETDAPADAPVISALIPLKGLSELKRICESVKSGIVTLQQDGSSLFVQAGLFDVSIKLADGQFPPYQQIIPEQSTGFATVMRLTLLDSLRAISIASPEHTDGIKLTFAKTSVTVEAEDSKSGDGSDEISAAYTGSKATVGINAKYLVDVLSALEDESVTIGVSDDSDPITVRATATTAWVGVSVIMPMRIG